MSARLRGIEAQYRWVATPAAIVILLAAAGRLAIWIPLQPPVDWEIYRDAALRWQAGDSYFLPYQLAGAYTVGHGEILYPPVILWLLVPFTHLPPIVWWLVPCSILAALILWWRPRGWPLVGMAICLALNTTQSVYLTGRPTMWICSFFALGLAGGGWAVLVLLKPSVFPAALVGVRRKSWWAALLVLAALCVPLGTAIWSDWLRAVGNSGGGALYNIMDLFVFGVPALAWLGRTRGRGSTIGYPGGPG